MLEKIRTKPFQRIFFGKWKSWVNRKILLTDRCSQITKITILRNFRVIFKWKKNYSINLESISNSTNKKINWENVKIWICTSRNIFNECLRTHKSWKLFIEHSTKLQIKLFTYLWKFTFWKSVNISKYVTQ